MSLPLAPPATAPRAAGAPTRPRKRSNLFTVRAGISRRTYWVLALTGLGLFELCRRRFSLHWERIQEEIEQLIQHRGQP